MAKDEHIKRTDVGCFLFLSCGLFDFMGDAMNERIKELAEQAGLEELGDGDWCSLNHPDVRAEHLERFAELVLQNYISQIMTTEEREENIRADEREANAKFLDDFSKTQMVPVKDTWRMGVMAAANAVRDKK